jgi:hypothetical protein
MRDGRCGLRSRTGFSPPNLCSPLPSPPPYNRGVFSEWYMEPWTVLFAPIIVDNNRGTSTTVRTI